MLNPTPAGKPGSALADLWNVTDAWPLQSGTRPKQTWIPHITNFTLQGLHSKEFCLFFLPGHDKKAQWSEGMGLAIPCQEFEAGEGGSPLPASQGFLSRRIFSTVHLLHWDHAQPFSLPDMRMLRNRKLNTIMPGECVDGKATLQNCTLPTNPLSSCILWSTVTVNKVHGCLLRKETIRRHALIPP